MYAESERERREAAAVIRSRRTAECELTKLPPPSSSLQSAAATINAANAYSHSHSPPSLSNMETIENSSASEGAR